MVYESDSNYHDKMCPNYVLKVAKEKSGLQHRFSRGKLPYWDSVQAIEMHMGDIKQPQNPFKISQSAVRNQLSKLKLTKNLTL